MNRLLKLVGFVIVGLAIAVVLYCLLAFGILEGLRARSGKSPESYLGIAFLIFLPGSLLVGSSITGFLAGQDIRGVFTSFWIVPGLYLALAVVPRSFVGTVPGFGAGMLILGIIWTLVSWVGVVLGRFIRMRTKAVLSRKGDD